MRRAVWAWGAAVFLMGCGGEPSAPVTPTEASGNLPTVPLSVAAREGLALARSARTFWEQGRDVEAFREATTALRALSPLEEELTRATPSAELAEVHHGLAHCGMILEDLEAWERWSQSAALMRRKLPGETATDTLASELLWAQARFTAHQDAKSLQELERAAAALEQLGDSVDAWWGLRWCGNALSTLFRPREALAYEQKALDLALRSNSRRHQIHSQLAIAELWRTLGDSERARSLTGPIHEELKQLEEHSVFAAEVAWTWASLMPEGEASRKALLRETAEAYRRLANDSAAAGAGNAAGWAWLKGAQVLLQASSYEEAESALQEVRRLGQELKNERLQAAFHWNRGSLLAAQEQSAAAVEELQKALSLVPQRPADVAALHHELGTVHQQAKNADRALAAFEASLSQAATHPHLGPQPYTAFLAGQIYEQAELPQAALQRYQQSQEGYTRNETKPDAAHLHGHVGNMQRKLGAWQAAADAYGQAVRQCRAFGLTADVPDYLKKQGEALLRAEDYTAAIPILNEARQLWPESGAQLDRPRLGLWLAICHLKEANLPAARSDLQEMNAVLEKLPASMGRAYFSRQAGDELQQAGHPSEAVQQYQQADKRLQEAGWEPYAALMQFLVGDCQRKLGEAEAAFASYQSGLDRLATLKRETEAAERYDAFGYMLLTLCSHNLLPEYLKDAVQAYKTSSETDRATELLRRQQAVDFPPKKLGIVGLHFEGTTTEEIAVELSRPDNANADRIETHVIIKSIDPEMPAALEGTAQIGDELVAVVQQDGTRREISGYDAAAAGLLVVAGVPGTSVTLVLKRQGSETTFKTKPITRRAQRMNQEQRDKFVAITKRLRDENQQYLRRSELDSELQRFRSAIFSLLPIALEYDGIQVVQNEVFTNIAKLHSVISELTEYIEILTPEGLIQE